MREIVAGSELAPILNRDRASTNRRVKELIQATLDSYESGINIVRVNLDKADPPREVIDASAKCRLLNRNATGWNVRPTPMPTGFWRVHVVKPLRSWKNPKATAPASSTKPKVKQAALRPFCRNTLHAPDVTRRRLYIETMEKVLGDIDKIILDEGVSSGSGQGVVPYLPLNELRRAPAAGGN